MINLMNKKAAGENIFSIWWVAIWIVIVAGFYVAMYMYSGVSISVQNIESDILAEKILSCVSEQDNLNQKVLQENFDIYKECGLSKNIFEKEKPDFYFDVLISDESGKLVGKEISGGDIEFKIGCSISNKVNSANYPTCSEKQEKLWHNGQQVNVKVLAASNQNGKREAIGL